MALEILTPVDGSPDAESARRVALQLAGGCGATVTALHVVNVRPPGLGASLTGALGFEPAVVSAEVAQAAVRHGQQLLDRFVAEGAAIGVTVNGVLEVGAVAPTLLTHVHDADLVVMGIRGETEARFPGQGGEMVTKLASKITAPMLLLPPGIARLERLGIAYDGSEGARHAVRAVRAVLACVALPVEAIYVSTDGTGGNVLEEVDAHLGPCRHRVVRADDCYGGLRLAALESNLSVLALGFHGRSRLHDFLYGTTTERLAIDGTLGLLVAR